jgi:hypothetical protein
MPIMGINPIGVAVFLRSIIFSKCGSYSLYLDVRDSSVYETKSLPKFSE